MPRNYDRVIRQSQELTSYAFAELLEAAAVEIGPAGRAFEDRVSGKDGILILYQVHDMPRSMPRAFPDQHGNAADAEPVA